MQTHDRNVAIWELGFVTCARKSIFSNKLLDLQPDCSPRCCQNSEIFKLFRMKQKMSMQHGW